MFPTHAFLSKQESESDDDDEEVDLDDRSGHESSGEEEGAGSDDGDNDEDASHRSAREAKGGGCLGRSALFRRNPPVGCMDGEDKAGGHESLGTVRSLAACSCWQPPPSWRV
jgi:hypothetical protein